MTSDPEKRKSYFQNYISTIGFIGSIFWFSVIVVFFILDFTAKKPNPYLSIITYVALPAGLVLSLALIVIGAFRERKLRHERGFVAKFPRIDFNNPRHQKIAYITVGVLTVFALFSIVGAYRTYEFTESVTFCGRMCHEVMEPEYTTYHASPHARVSCAECHIGAGADWYVRSKLSGSYQIYSTLLNKFHRPIETPVKNLRPAQETCEQCHWPEKFYGAIEEDKTYFLPDEANTEWNLKMLMFVGGGRRKYGKKEGIHWHMNINNTIDYIATDEKRLVIPWVRQTASDGSVNVYVSDDTDFTAENPPAGEMRRMDCIDCHNRPSHIFKAPSGAVNELMGVGTIDPTIPYIKREAVNALVGEYASKKEALRKIRERLERFYKEKYPELWRSDAAKINRSIQAVLAIYRQNFFPEMKASWEAYPNHLGHLNFVGCFRCHDGKHKTAGGRMISNSCTSCHSIISQGSKGAEQESVEGLEFKHPEDIGGMWREANCSDCHTGGPI